MTTGPENLTATASASVERVPVSFVTVSSAFVVSDRPILVPVSSTPAELSDLVRHLILADGEPLDPSVVFNFLFETATDKVLLRGQLEKTLLEEGWTLERTVRLEYFEASPEPQLEATIAHPDWIRCITSAANGGRFATGCHDGSVRLFAAKGDTPQSVTLPHGMAVTGTAFIPVSAETTRLATVSMDQTGCTLHTVGDNEAEVAFTFTVSAAETTGPGVKEQLSTVAVSRRGDLLAAGTADGKIAVFSAKRDAPGEEISTDAPTEAATGKKRVKKTPVATAKPAPGQRRARFVLEGAHSAPVTALLFDRVDHKATGSPLLFSASLDGSIRAWDLVEQSFAFILSVDSPVTALAHHPTIHKLLLSGHPDGSVRLWDLSEPLTVSSALLPSTFFAGNPAVMTKRLAALHRGWITGLAWSPYDEHLFASIGHDGALCIWDTRSADTTATILPQYKLRAGNELKDVAETEKRGRLLALDWAADGRLRCGGEDATLHVYATRRGV